MSKKNLINFEYLRGRENDFLVKNQEIVARMYKNPKFEKEAHAVDVLRADTEAFEETLLHKQPGNKVFTDIKLQKRKQLEHQSKLVGELLQQLALPEPALSLLIWEAGFPLHQHAHKESRVLIPPTDLSVKILDPIGEHCTARLMFKKPSCKFLFTQLAVRFLNTENPITDYFSGLSYKDLFHVIRGGKMYVRARTVDTEGQFSEWSEEVVLFI